jgi:hypothetical protein
MAQLIVRKVEWHRLSMLSRFGISLPPNRVRAQWRVPQPWNGDLTRVFTLGNSSHYQINISGY